MSTERMESGLQAAFNEARNLGDAPLTGLRVERRCIAHDGHGALQGVGSLGVACSRIRNNPGRVTNFLRCALATPDPTGLAHHAAADLSGKADVFQWYILSVLCQVPVADWQKSTHSLHIGV